MKPFKPFENKYIVGTSFIYGWDFVWSTDDEDGRTIPLVYNTMHEAQDGIADDIKSIEEAIKAGDMQPDSISTLDEYIICMASMTPQGIVTVTFPGTHETKTFDITNHY